MYGYGKAIERKSCFCKSLLICALSKFKFRHFEILQTDNPLKVGTDSLVLGTLVTSEIAHRVLDLGTGTGILALMMAQKFPDAQIEAIELHKFGARECEQNFLNCLWSDRLHLIQGDYYEFPFSKKYDLIVSNPPYHVETIISKYQDMDNAKRTDLKNFKQLLQKISDLLLIEGTAWLILPYSLFEQINPYLTDLQLFIHQLITIHGNERKQKKRVVFSFGHLKKNTITSELTIRNLDGTYTDAYKTLTKDFHDRLL